MTKSQIELKIGDTITVGKYTFTVTDRIPNDYTVWAADCWSDAYNPPANFLPLCKTRYGSNIIDVDSLLIVNATNVADILQAAGYGLTTLEAMDLFVKKNKNALPGSWEAYKAQVATRAAIALRNVPQALPEELKRDREKKRRKDTIGDAREVMRVISKVELTPEILDAVKVSKGKWNYVKLYIIDLLKERISETKQAGRLNARQLPYLCGKPIYIRFLLPEYARANSNQKSRWVILEECKKGSSEIVTSHLGTLSLSDYGVTWEAYDKPFTPANTKNNK